MIKILIIILKFQILSVLLTVKRIYSHKILRYSSHNPKTMPILGSNFSKPTYKNNYYKNTFKKF